MPTRTDATAVLPKNFVRPCVLLLLRERAGHGYDLLVRLSAFGFERDPGRLYRELRALEQERLVRSSWEASDAGPDRRVYEITRIGMEYLHERAAALLESRDVLEQFLSRYGEFAALASDRTGVR